jgi:hypothetical protein
MSKTQKELAFLREMSVESEWTERFTDYLDGKFKFDKEESLLYVNAGAGNHALALREKLGDETEIYAVSDNEDLRAIAQAKADAVKADIQFGTYLPDEKSNVVIADATFVKPYEINEFLADVIDAADKQAVFFLPTKGSFGEIFSFLWETLFETNLVEKGENVERLISEIPTIEDVVEEAERLGLGAVEHSTQTEVFEFKNGTEFINAPLLADFLLPVWLDFLTDSEQEKVGVKLAELIDKEDGELTFRFSVKNTLFSGAKDEGKVN